MYYVCYGKLLLQVPLRQSSYPSYLWLLWQHRPSPNIVDSWHQRVVTRSPVRGITGQQRELELPQPLTRPVTRTTCCCSLHWRDFFALTRQSGAQPGLANEILIFSTVHICRRYLWFLSKKAAQSSVIRPQLKSENNGHQMPRIRSHVCTAVWTQLDNHNHVCDFL